EANGVPLGLFVKGAGVYPCRAILVRRTAHVADVRVVDLKLTVEAAQGTTTLVFKAPARQRLVQDIPIRNSTAEDWVLLASARLPPFSGPAQLVVPAGGSAKYPLAFAPPRRGDEATSRLVLSDLRLPERPVRFQFELRGTAEEPLAEAHRVVRCVARQKVTELFHVTNAVAHDVTYDVESDVPGVSGAASLTVPAHGSANYALTVCPATGGATAGSLIFSEASAGGGGGGGGVAGGDYVWFTVEVQADNAAEEDTIEVSTTLRQAVSLEISLGNPLDETLSFQVVLEGDGLLGEPTFELLPLHSASYTLYYSPRRANVVYGSVRFLNDKVGAFWYKLRLLAAPAPAADLGVMHCAVGASASRPIQLENPLGREVTLTTRYANGGVFSIEPPRVTLPPLGTATAAVIFTPAALG
ncbi:unnamed protein product, partial [Phaeothamnion confervicola]